MRRIVLDTETTGMEPQQGHRIIEIGCVELDDRHQTGNHFHRYINPQREVDQGASEVHGMTWAGLAEYPAFADIAQPLLTFLQGAELIIHNAPFDVAFLDAELAWLGADWGSLASHGLRVVDSLVLAREQYPGQRNSLDALCKRHDVDHAGRELHGALLDAELLADVYRGMTGGQTALGFASAGAATGDGSQSTQRPARRQGAVPVIRADDDEHAQHERRLAAIEESAGTCLWSGT